MGMRVRSVRRSGGGRDELVGGILGDAQVIVRVICGGCDRELGRVACFAGASVIEVPNTKSFKHVDYCPGLKKEALEKYGGGGGRAA